MKTLLISDIHGNYLGLEAIMADAGTADFDRLVCLGDIVDGGDEDEAVVKLLRENSAKCVIGNHDQFNDLFLPEEVEGFLASLPKDIIEGDVIYTHISSRKKKLKVCNPIEAWNVFEETFFRLTFVGHTHYPLIYGANCDQPVSAREYPIEYGVPFEIDPSDRYIFTIGSAGYGRDYVGLLRYAIFAQGPGPEYVEMRAVSGPLLEYDYVR